MDGDLFDGEDFFSGDCLNGQDYYRVDFCAVGLGYDLDLAFFAGMAYRVVVDEFGCAFVKVGDGRFVVLAFRRYVCGVRFARVVVHCHGFLIVEIDGLVLDTFSVVGGKYVIVVRGSVFVFDQACRFGDFGYDGLLACRGMVEHGVDRVVFIVRFARFYFEDGVRTGDVALIVIGVD